jgi:hypothetical protein
MFTVSELYKAWQNILGVTGVHYPYPYVCGAGFFVNEYKKQMPLYGGNEG